MRVKMGGSASLLLLLVLSVLVSHSASTADTADIEIAKNVSGVLGETVVLKCRYTGDSEVMISTWTQKQSNGKWKNVVMFYMNDAQVTDGFSVPLSSSNLTVKMDISSLQDEREYKCSFITDSENLEETMTLTVLARPSVQTNVVTTLENGTHYQTVTCSAIGGKPEASVSWLVYDKRSSNAEFSVTANSVQHSNDTSTQTSMLRLPTHLLNESNVTCVVNHVTLVKPTHVRVKVQTFVAPVVTLDTMLVQEKEEEFQVVTCKATKGRPAPRLTWSLPGGMSAPEGRNMMEKDINTDTETVITSRRFPAYLHEEQNVTCVIVHPKFPSEERRTITLPIYRFSALRVLAPKSLDAGYVLLEEGQTNVSIQLEVVGNVPRYQINCTKEDRLLPAGMSVIGSSLWVVGPVESCHAGKYECQASYYHHKISVQLEIQVNPVKQKEVPVTPNVTIQTWEEENQRTIQCSAADATPAANVSWVLPEGLPATTWSNSTLHNGTHTVTVVLLLPVCLSKEYQVQCVIEHPALSDIRQMTIPACLFEVSVSFSTIREKGTQYTQLNCRADSSQPAATITWSLNYSHGSSAAIWLQEVSTTNWTHNNGSVTVLSVVQVPNHSFPGGIVVCKVTHKALEEPVRREVWIPATESPVMHVSVKMHQSSPLFLAVCESSWGLGTFDLSWVLPSNNTGRTLQTSRNTGGRFWANSTYEFPLDLHEGQNLTCKIKNEHITAEKTVHIPQYYISTLRLLNSKKVAYSGSQVMQKVSLKTHLHNQRIPLKVYGKIPVFNITCVRSDGSPVRTEGASLVFPSPVSLHDAGLYTCRASFYHHHTTLLLQVEVTEEDQEFWAILIICIPAAIAIALILIVSLCVFCKRHRGDSSKSAKRESLAALTSLLAEHRSPEIKKSTPPALQCDEKDHTYPELFRYSIVIDIKSTV